MMRDVGDASRLARIARRHPCTRWWRSSRIVSREWHSLLRLLQVLPPSSTGNQTNTKLPHLDDLRVAREPVASIEDDDGAPSSQRAQGRDPVVRVVQGVRRSPGLLYWGRHAQLEVVVAEEADDGAGLAADPAARKDVPGQVGGVLRSGEQWWTGDLRWTAGGGGGSVASGREGGAPAMH